MGTKLWNAICDKMFDQKRKGKTLELELESHR